MKILNIHGYHGSPGNSLYAALRKTEHTVVGWSIDYDHTSPEFILQDLVGKCCYNEVDAVAGTSLGGFFALLISVKLELPALVVNPALVPDYQIPRLEDCNLDYGYLKEYFYLGKLLRGIDLRLVSTIIGTEDEVIDNHAYTELILGNSRFIKVPGGQHSGATLGLESILKERGDEFFCDTSTKDLDGFSAP